ncbi:MAG: glycosyltransferase [Alphaproteobacteria bacterium]|nr:glycosyltransferase [Alphaproteobacteria bacterium]
MSANVTLVITQRERMALSEMSLENILADQSEPFRLIYVDGGSPEPVRAYLERRVNEVGGMLIRRPEWLWPNASRNLALPHVETPYVVFIDNDVVVERGWLRKLVAAAEETGAALVGPLYLVSDGVGEPRIHMAGGTLTRVETDAGVALHERHELLNAPLADGAALTRSACDFVEYHCALARTDFLRRAGGLSEDIVCVHEHIDVALDAKAAGLPVVFEPTAVVTQHAFAPYTLSDLAFHRWRWRREAAESSLLAFCRKWDLVDDDQSMKGIRGFVDALTSSIDPLVPWLERSRPQQPLDPNDVKQSLYGLLTQAFAQGYSQADLDLFTKAHNAAMTMFVGGFRSCMRPFTAHCIGTASALVAFGFAPRVVVAGLLHAAYSHAPLGPQPHVALSELSTRISATFGERVEQLIRRYARFQQSPVAWRDAHPVDALSVDDAEIVAIAIANEIDEWASGELHISRKKPPTSPEWTAYFATVANALDVPTFARTLAVLADSKPPEGFVTRHPHSESFRLVKGGAAPMAHGAFRTWDANMHGAPIKHTG